MGNLITRLAALKAAKCATVVAMATLAAGLTTPLSSAANERSWHEGCRGYWYSTVGHGYCQNATGWPSYGYFTDYDCNVEADAQHHDYLSRGYVGKYDTYECVFKINKTKVHQ
ncbi:hypothetical protein SLA_4431 [Streptomyces laurentii]|uniref:Uncharacterized protein n=1 Tax=Streptomyces laurentii TaxID=39478 RepID=A0A160P1M1_STRLU|nr:hypothetical protein SLA_4431 [Streptomyces laurentii]